MNLNEDPLIEEFMFAVKSQNTQELYLKNLGYFYEFANIDSSRLLKSPVTNIQDLLKKYVISYEKSRNSVRYNQE